MSLHAIKNCGRTAAFRTLRVETLESRLAPSIGSLDLTFGGTGKVLLPGGLAGESVSAIAVDSIGRLIVAGNPDAGSSVVVARVHPDGSLDSTFGANGQANFSFGGSTNAAFAVAIDDLGRIIVAGATTPGPHYDFAVARLSADGMLDPSFGNAGVVLTSIGPESDVIRAASLDEQGRILVAGYASNGTYDDFALARYLDNGTLDTSFGAAGKVVTPIGSNSEEAFALTIDGSGRILASGYSEVGGIPKFALVRYLGTGQVDTLFGNAGRVLTAFQAGSAEYGTDLAIDSFGRIIQGDNSDLNFALVRLLDDGTPDAGFGTNGKVLTAGAGGLTGIAAGLAAVTRSEGPKDPRPWSGSFPVPLRS